MDIDPTSEDFLIRSDEAKQFAQDVLIAAGAQRDHAIITADNLIFADRSGIASHGLLRLPLYAQAASHGGINVAPEMRWVHRSPGGGLLDADSAFGQVAMQEAVTVAKDLLTHSASVVISVQSSSHFGAGAFWANMLAERGYIAIITSTTGPAVAPFGGSKKLLGTNPLSVAVPTEEPQHPLTLDMATSTGAYGKIVAARNAGTTVPPGWAVDAEGNPTVDPTEALNGALTPFGGHKGSGLAVTLEALSACLGQAAYAYQTEDIWDNPSSQMNVGHTLIGINPEYFGGLKNTKARTHELQAAVRAAGSTVYAPGDIESSARATMKNAISVSRSTHDLLLQTAEAWRVPMPREPLAI